MNTYGARTINKRDRRTQAEMEALRVALYQIVEEHHPITVRGTFYRATALGVVPKEEKSGYRPVQRQLLKMRRDGVVPWG